MADISVYYDETSGSKKR